MSARALWRGVVRFAGAEVPVKLYAAVEDRDVHFRLLHEPDEVPVTRELVHPETGEVVPFADAKRGYVTAEGDLVILEPDELDALAPEPSRVIDVVRFTPRGAIDPRWYVRPYYLGPDGEQEAFAALAAALERREREGLARWTMRRRGYLGALRMHRGHLMLITLRSDPAVLADAALAAPADADLDPRELDLARRILETLAAPFEPEAYADTYRQRVLDLIAAKARGEPVRLAPPPERPRFEDLGQALRASLERERPRA